MSSEDKILILFNCYIKIFRTINNTEMTAHSHILQDIDWIQVTPQKGNFKLILALKLNLLHSITSLLYVYHQCEWYCDYRL